MLNTFDRKYSAAYDALYHNKDYKSECGTLRKIFDKFCESEIKNILNLGCGTGRHDVELAKCGYTVKGVDLSEDMISFARERARDVQNVSYEQANVLDIKYNNQFDVVLSMFTVVSYINDRENLLKFFQKVHTALKGGGIFIFDLWNGLAVPTNYSPHTKKEIKVDGKKIIRESSIDVDPFNQICKINFNVKIFEDDQEIDQFNEIHNMRFYTVMEIKDALLEAGFGDICCFPFGEIDKKLTMKDWDVQFVAKK
ncbi:class I SAM-dependent methyltransferase [bacterium]|nr:class I SAM-dependent methyltransferase [bacterium]